MHRLRRLLVVFLVVAVLGGIAAAPAGADEDRDRSERREQRDRDRSERREQRDRDRSERREQRDRDRSEQREQRDRDRSEQRDRDRSERREQRDRDRSERRASRERARALDAEVEVAEALGAHVEVVEASELPVAVEPVEESEPSVPGEPSLGSLTAIVDQIGARDLWAAGHTGAGIDVAVIDTGVAPLPALVGDGRLAAAVDLSLEAGIPEATFLDTYGHGSHIAGIIAGADPGVDPLTATPDDFLGVAPGARLVSLKVADNTGAVDVSQVIAAIDWVVEHRQAGDLDIRVLNLSYGVDGLDDPTVDPLVAAVQRAWDAGIVVVVAAGNDGWASWGLTSPATNPYVISVGAAEARSDGSFGLPTWSSGAQLFTTTNGAVDPFWSSSFAGRTPDLVAPAASVEGLRVPGSRIDVENPSARIGDGRFRGSGSSQAAAIVSGAVALLLEQRPGLEPDQVKALLTSTANPIPFALPTHQGRGVVDLVAASAASTPDPASVMQAWVRSSGLGSLDAARGTQRVTIDGLALEGEVTAWGTPWDPAGTDAATLAAFPTGASWTGTSWTGASWTGASWTGTSWTGTSWTGTSWTGASWTGASWTGASWTGASWTGASWTGAAWG